MSRRAQWVVGALGFAWFSLIPAFLPLPNVWWPLIGVFLTTTLFCVRASGSAAIVTVWMAGGLTVALVLDLVLRGTVLAVLGDRTEWLRYLLLEWVAFLVGASLGGFVGWCVAKMSHR